MSAFPRSTSYDSVTRASTMAKLYAWVCAAEAFLARTFLLTMVALIFGSGIARLLGSPINWAIDVATCIFAWGCFFSADVAWRRSKLMSVELLTNRLPARGQKACRMVNYCILTAFLLYVIPAGVWLSYVSRARSFQGIPTFSYSWVTMSLPVGAAMLLTTTILKMRDELKSSGKGS
jgi:TRAP-type C4-dicarboxylate transport system permease small subunit